MLTPQAEIDGRLQRAQSLGYITLDGDDQWDAAVESYRRWCAEIKAPFIVIALKRHTAALTCSLIEMEGEFSPAAEAEIAHRLPAESLMDAGIIIEPDYCLAPLVANDSVCELAVWLYDRAFDA